MGRVIRNYQEGDEITPLVKEMTQEAINLFEGSSGHSGPCLLYTSDAADE